MNSLTVDVERVMSKIAYIKAQLSDIEKLINTKEKKHIIGDPWMIKGLKYSLQTSIEAMIDIIFHICAKHFNQAPVDARNGLEILVENKIIDKKYHSLSSILIGLRLFLFLRCSY